MQNKSLWFVAAMALLTVLPVRAHAQCSHQPVILIIKTNELKLTPAEPKCLFSENGEDPTFDIRIKPPGAAQEGYVTVVEKGDRPPQISGDNSGDPNTVVVTVSGNTNPDEDYGYIVRVTEHGDLDPEVRVVESRLFMRTLIEEADALLEEVLGISVPELADQYSKYMKTNDQAE
jgi:hypothetical protein